MGRTRFCITVALPAIARSSLTIIAAGIMTAAACGPVFAQGTPMSGLYAGITGGFAWGNGTHTSQVIPVPAPPPLPPDDGKYSLSGAAVGVSAGYNLWFGKLLLGGEADYAAAWIDGHSFCTVSRCTGEARTFGTARGRLGYDLAGWVVFASGGLAFADFKATSATGPGYSGSDLRTGWTAGAGVERAISRTLSLKLEYLYADFGRDAHFTIAGHTPERIDVSLNMVRLGLNLKLGD